MFMNKKIMIVAFAALVIGAYVYFLQVRPKQESLGGDKNPSTAVKLRKYIHNKLWRDKAVENLEETYGDIIHRKNLTDEEYAHQLHLKLLEEAQEVMTATSSEELASEIGDVLEVLDCIITLHNLSRQEIEQMRNKKRQIRGSYLERKFVTTTESVPGSFLDLYCAQAPDKYTLIID